MALLHWRKFVFFDEEYVVDTELNQLVSLEEPKDVIDDGQPFVTVKLSCSSSGRGNILLGDTNGYVYIINRYLKVNSFRANQKFTSHVKQVPKLPIFITCGSDQDGIYPLIKLWDPEKTDRLGQPTCIRLIRANSGFTKPSAVTCIECNDSLTLMAVGYEDGTIVLFHGDITKQRRSKFGRPIKVSEHPITGIVIRSEARITQNISSASGYLNQTTTQSETTAFISTNEEIFYANLSEKAFSKVLLDQSGCKPKCHCLLPDAEGKTVSENLFAVGRDNAVYFYHIDGRGPCLAFEGEKLVLYRFKTYMVILSRDSPTKIDSNILRGRRLQASDMNGSDLSLSTKRVNLNIYDIKNKYIAHSSSIPEIQEIFSEWGHLFVVCANGQVIIFREKDTQTKLETLFKKNQFSLVIDIAKSHQYNEDALTEIFKHYGDHLYRKGDYDGAILQYIKTIGSSEPSYVIKKFLDSKRISNLIVYLEALHKKSHANQDHTKLLLNCYSYLRDNDQIKQFIKSYENGDIEIEADVAIKILRDSGFDEFANYLSEKHQKHESIHHQASSTDDTNAIEVMLEMYLNEWRKEKDDLMRSSLADKIKKLLAEESDKFDLDQALILCRNNRFDDGLIDLYARAKLFHLVLQYHIDQDDSLKIIKTCEQYGSEDPNLYMPALVHYSKTGDERLSQILKAIEHHKLIPPMVVIKILLESKRSSLGHVKEYLVRFLGKLHDKHLDNENAIDHYKDDTEVVRQRIEEFENHQTVFKPSKCSACQGILDLPSVHFLCSHSYHQNCFHNYSAENDECPICVTTNKKLLDEIGSHETSKSTLEKLDKQFSAPNDDNFNSLAKLFGYGLFD